MITTIMFVLMLDKWYSTSNICKSGYFVSSHIFIFDWLRLTPCVFCAEEYEVKKTVRSSHTRRNIRWTGTWCSSRVACWCIALCFKGRVREVPNHQIQQAQAGSKNPAFFGFLGLGGSSCQNAPQCMKDTVTKTISTEIWSATFNECVCTKYETNPLCKNTLEDATPLVVNI